MEETRTIDDLEMLEELKKKLYDTLGNKPHPSSVGALLKVIEMKKKLSVSGKAEKRFWDMINELRQETLTKKRRPGTAKKQKAD